MTPDSPDIGRPDRPVGPELTRVHGEFFAARHDESDVEWAQTAFASMVFDDVRIDVAEHLLNEIAPTVREAQESPEELFGPAVAWADERMAELKREGVDVFEDPLRLDVREVVVYSFGSASVLSALVVVSELFSALFGADGGPDRLSLGLALMPLLISVLIMVLISVYKRTTARFRFPIAAAACAAVVVGGAVTIASLIMPLGQVTLPAHPLWIGVLIPVYAAACWAGSRLWPKVDPPSRPTVQQVLDPQQVDDATWIARARTRLRERADLSDQRIEEVLAEAEGHGHDSGGRLIKEFGSPEGYAQSLPADPRVKPRRLTMLYALVALGWLTLGLRIASTMEWELSWSTAIYPVLVLLSAWEAVFYARRWRAAAASMR